MRVSLLALLMTFVGFAAWAEEPEQQPADETASVAEAAAEEPAAEENRGDGIKSNSKIDIDNNTRFRYQVGYWCPLIDASICCAVA